MLLRFVINLFKFSWDTDGSKHISLSTCHFTGQKNKRMRKVPREKPHTLNTADTVWKEEPFFFPPFLPPAESPAEGHTELGSGPMQEALGKDLYTCSSEPSDKSVGCIGPGFVGLFSAHT